MLARAEQAEQLHRFFEVRKLEYVDMARVAGVQQVQIQVRVAEVSRQAIRALGINFDVNDGTFTAGSLIGSDGGGPINPIATGTNGQRGISNAVTVFGTFNHNTVNVFIQALAENQYLRILAEPSLTALSGEKASFLVGGEIPIPVAQNANVGTTAITIEYKEFGVPPEFQAGGIGRQPHPDVFLPGSERALAGELGDSAWLVIADPIVRDAAV